MNITHGTSIEITEQLSSRAAQSLAQWIGGYNVITNQKTIASNDAYKAWVDAGKPEDAYPDINGQTSYLTKSFPFLKDIPCQIRRSAGAKWVESVNAAKFGLRSRPKVKSKYKKRNCYVTNELFDVQAIDDERCLVQIKYDAKKSNRGNFLVGVVMPFPKEDAGKALYISRKGKRFWVSMSFSLEKDILSESDIKKALVNMSDDELESQLTGYDLGVKRQVTGSDKIIHHISDEAQQKITEIEKRRVRYQRRYARVSRANDRNINRENEKKKQSKAKEASETIKKRERTKNERKLSAKIAKYGEKIANIKHYNSHCISKEIAKNTPLCAVFEDLKLTNMTRRPKPKKCDETGRWLVNGASAKAGLNKALLGANLGQIRTFTRYKLAEQSKIMILVSPHYSSRECSECGHIHKDNRPTQDLFYCQKCHHTENADDNAAKALKKRGIQHIRSETFSKEKTVRGISTRRKTKVHEPASLGSGESISLAQQAIFGDALKTKGHETTLCS
jgi:putative transposase